MQSTRLKSCVFAVIKWTVCEQWMLHICLLIFVVQDLSVSILHEWFFSSCDYVCINIKWSHHKHFLSILFQDIFAFLWKYSGITISRDLSLFSVLNEYRKLNSSNHSDDPMLSLFSVLNEHRQSFSSNHSDDPMLCLAIAQKGFLKQVNATFHDLWSIEELSTSIPVQSLSFYAKDIKLLIKLLIYYLFPTFFSLLLVKENSCLPAHADL